MVKIEIRRVKKDKIKDFIETDVLDLSSRRALDAKLRELRTDNYVLEYQKHEGNEGKKDTLEMRDTSAGKVVL